jgi:hypothetical protein
MESTDPKQQTASMEAFLKCEEDVDRLLEELTHLRQEAESYASARQTVDKAAEGVSTLSTDLVGLASRLREIVDTLRSISTPQILEQLAGVKNDVSETRSQIHNQVEQSREEARSTRELLNKELMGARDLLNSELAGVRSALQDDLQRHGEELNARLSRQAQRSEDAFTELSVSDKKFQAKLFWLAGGLGGLQLIILAVILWRVIV